MRKTIFSKFTQDTEGSIAILSAAVMVAMLGAVGLGTDTYIAQSTEAALQHVVDLSCERLKDTDLAVAPTIQDANVLTETFGNNLKVGTRAKDAYFSAAVVGYYSGSVYSQTSLIYSSTTFTPTFTAILGAKPFNIEKKTYCDRTRVIKKATEGPGPTPKSTCNVVLTYLDTTRKNSVSIKDLSQYATIEKVGGKNVVNYIYTVVDKNNVMTKREFFSKDLNIDPKDLENYGKDQTMYVQVMNADGSVPKLEEQCITQTQVTKEPKVTELPPDTPDCTKTVGKFADLKYAAGDMSGRVTENGDWKTTSFADYTISPEVTDVIKGITSVITVTRISTGDKLLVPITKNFHKLDPTNQDVIDATEELRLASKQDKNVDPESAFLIGMMAKTDATLNQTPGQISNHQAYEKRILNNYRLDTIISGSSGSWQKPGDTTGRCEASISPIVIDLTNKGSIATTGTSTAQKAVRASIGKTITFDMLGNGNPQKMEWIVGNGQGFLVDNRDGNAEKDMSGKRLFGNTAQHANGYSKLAVMFPPDKDGILTGDSLKGLGVWVDNGDGIVQSGEIKSLSELGITQISTRMETVKDNNGDMLMRSYVIRNNIKILSEDVWFGVGK
jgi:hypothetical protein